MSYHATDPVCAGTPWLLLSLALSAPAAPAVVPDQVLRAAPRVPAVAVVVTPFGRASALGTSALVDGLAAALERRTDLEVRSAEQAGVDLGALLACPAEQRLTCWARTVRRDLADGRAPAEGAPRHLFVISARPISDRLDRVAITWMDLDAVARIFSARDEVSAASFEDRLFTEALHSRPRRLGSEALEAGLSELVRAEWQDRLRALGRWGPRGDLELAHDCAGCRLAVDERPLGVVRPGRVRVLDLSVGARTITLAGPAAEQACLREAQITTGPPAQVDLRGCAPSAPAGVGTAVARWTGVGLVALGAVLGGVAIERAASGPSTVCVGGDACPGLGLPTPGFDPGASPAIDPAAVNPSGPPWAALSGGALGAGAALVTGSLLLEEEDWWWSPIAAILLGGATYAAIAVGGGR